jgi:hypothetical protein
MIYWGFLGGGEWWLGVRGLPINAYDIEGKVAWLPTLPTCAIDLNIAQYLSLHFFSDGDSLSPNAYIITSF